MITAAFLASLFLMVPLQEPPPEEPGQQPPVEEPVPAEQEEQAEEPPPTPEEAVAMLKEAFKGDDFEALQVVLNSAGMVADKDVVKELAKGVKHKVNGFRVATLMALRWNEAPEALDALLKMKRDKKLWDNAGTGEAYAMALGQKAGEDAAEVLADIVTTQDIPHQVTKAAIRGLARCRVPEAPEAIMDFVNGAPIRARNFMDDVRISMGVLLGYDAGTRPGEWTKWWQDQGKGMAVPEEPFEIPQERVRLEWLEVWKSPAEKEAERKAQEERQKQKQDEIDRRRREGEPE